jgi:toxin ParE1/3/4
MSLRIEYAPWFDADFRLRTAWYVEHAGVELAEGFITAVEVSVKRIADNPWLGRRPYPRDVSLAEVRSLVVEKPFHRHVLFYRISEDTLKLERLIHGARDLPRRIQESPYEPRET